MENQQQTHKALGFLSRFVLLLLLLLQYASHHTNKKRTRLQKREKERERYSPVHLNTTGYVISLSGATIREGENKFTCTQSCYVYGRRSARRREDNINVGVRCCCCCCSPSAGQHLWVCVRVYIKTHKSAGEKEKRINRRPCHAHSARAAFGYLFLSIDELPLPRSEKNIYCSCEQRCIVSTA